MNETPSILIVDDEVVNLMTLEWMLRDAGFETWRAASGPEARALAPKVRPDLIILDIVMPGEDGFTTCEKLLADPAVGETPIIFISGLGDVDNKVRGLKMGAVDYIAKPFAKEEVLARVKLHIRLRQGHAAMLKEQTDKLSQIREAQQAILVDPGEIPEARFAVRYVPVLEAGGDFYDVFPLTERSMGYFVADISGHDLGASFVTSSLKALLRQNSGPLYTPQETLKNINAVLAGLLKDGKHLTAALAALNRSRGKLTLVNAGHPPPILVTAAGQTSLLDVEGDILGVFDHVQLGILERKVEPGDRIFLYTDGLVERFRGEIRPRGQGIEALALACLETRNLPMPAAIFEASRRLNGAGHMPDDDMVLLGFEV
ncbi:PP2C family protein-serine/threonine phosphatase [Desulfolutivibrio sp.]|uniref:PP2C family protein-serine/threonine phosphatase n=1 Tax=Desulfolutivibrio sp. TaxID=2773296 RepID=UPI002F965FFD